MKRSQSYSDGMNRMQIQLETLLEAGRTHETAMDATPPEDQDEDRDEARTITVNQGVTPRVIQDQDLSSCTATSLECEDELFRARVYTRTAFNATRSCLSLGTFGSRWTQLSGMSLGQISNAAIILLPIYEADLPPSTSQWFQFGGLGLGTDSLATHNFGSGRVRRGTKAQRRSVNQQSGSKTSLQWTLQPPTLIVGVDLGTLYTSQ